MRSAFWAELRRSPLRWWLPVLAVLHIGVLAGGQQSWLGDWPRASAAALQPVVFLGPVLAAGAAWAGARSGLPGVADRMSISARAGWVPDAAQMVSSAAIGLAGYLAGLAYVALASFSQAGPGFLWPDYVLLGAAATVACAAIGHATGRSTGSRFGAPVAAGVGCLVLMMVFSSLLGLTGYGGAVLGDPAYSVAPGALATRVLLALGLAVVAIMMPSLLGRVSGRWHPPPLRYQCAAIASAAVVTSIALMPGQQVLHARTAPARPLCSRTVPRACLWPEDRKFLADVTALAARAGHLPSSLFRIPGTFYEQGLRPGTLPAGTSGFSLDNGSVSDGSLWFVANDMQGEVYAMTFGSRACLPPSMSHASYDRLEQASFLLSQWLTTRIYGGRQPATVFGAPPGVSPVAVGHLAQQPQAIQTAFIRTRAQLQARYDCRAHAQS